MTKIIVAQLTIILIIQEFIKKKKKENKPKNSINIKFYLNDIYLFNLNI